MGLLPRRLVKEVEWTVLVVEGCSLTFLTWRLCANRLRPHQAPEAAKCVGL